jgi:hypothetical protein
VKAFRWAVWPVGLVLTLAYAGAALLPLPVFLILDLAYVVAVAVAVRRAGSATAPLTVPAALIFSLAALTGAPTARQPGAMVANAAVLGAAAGVLLIGVVLITAQLWDGPGRGPAAVATVTLAIGTTCYLINLIARFAVVLAGAAPAQANVEDTAWQAHAYLRGLDGEPSPLTLLLVWLDLLQSSYLVLTYLAAALVAMALYRAGWITAGPTRVVATLGILLAIAATAGGVLGSVSAELGAAGASIAFALTIPFMSTLLPSLLGAAIGGRPESRQGRHWTAPLGQAHLAAAG